MEAKKPVIIVITGPSYSGKTTIRKYIQKMSPLGFIFVGFDLISEHMICVRDTLEFGKTWPYEKYLNIYKDPNDFIIVDGGKDYFDLFPIRHSLFKSLASNKKNNIIIEEVFVEFGEPLSCYLQHVDLNEFEVYLIGIKRDEEVAKNRVKGRDQFQITTQEIGIKKFDLLIENNGDRTPEEIAQEVVDYVNSHKPMAVYSEENRSQIDPNYVM